MRTLRVSVRRLVEFLLRSGDIDSERDWRGSIEAMQAGSQIHRSLQAAGGKAYQAEVPLAGAFLFPDGAFNPHAARLDIREDTVREQQGFFLRVEGRADGIIDDGTHPLTIDEIKGLSRDISDLEEPATLHEAQALCYAYLYLRSTRGPAALSCAFEEQVVVRLTYASMTTGEVRQLERRRGVPDIEAWFFALLEKAQRWAAWRARHDERRGRFLSSLAFPFAPRAGQREILDAVSSAIHEGKRLYLQAPTGSGKTVATLYPALKALGSGAATRIAYLTAKSTTRRAALACLELLRQQGGPLQVLVVTARDKICPLRERAQAAGVRSRPLSSLCNPLECPYARGHYDAVNDALYEAIATHDVLDAPCMRAVAERHHVCPYELQRDAARWADVVICDYHYAFAPSASLLGLADEPESSSVYLVDEAHNLVERMREQYSAELAASELEGLGRLLRASGGLGQLAQAVDAAAAAFPRWERGLPDEARARAQRRARHPSYQVAQVSDELREALDALADGLGTALEQLSPAPGNPPGGERPATAGGRAVELFLAVRDASYRVRAFIAALQRAEAGYVTFLSSAEGGGRQLKVYCVDPRRDLDARLEQAKAAVFFSGTLLPLAYHRTLLAAREGDPTLYAQTGFDPTHLQVLVGTDVSARYSRRGAGLYARVAAYLAALMRARPGNYLAFLPSYALLDEVAKALGPLVDGRVAMARQRPGMREDERERFVGRFRERRAGGTSLLGLCVLGGIFGESIDLPGEELIGVVVVGTGMPTASSERELIRDYYDAKEGKGFAYAYTFPGMCKVLQAAGRLIRTEQDRGVVLLLDDRFCERELQEAFPREWAGAQPCTLETLPGLLRAH